MFRHPKYYKELRKARNELAKRNAVKEDLACSGSSLARNNSDQAISPTRATAPSRRATGPGLKPQAASAKLQAPSDSNSKPQASSDKQQASSSKPQASSSKIWEPRKSFMVPGPRASTKINVLCGCFTWKLIWCGLRRTLLPFVTFNSSVKKWPELLQPNRSGVPSKLLFSSLIQEILGIDFLIFAYNFRSGFKVTRAF